MIYRIRVWGRSTGDHRPVGEMVCEIAEGGRARGAFRYEREYLERDDAFALDPVSLPLKPESFSTEHPGIFGTFEDALPDDWAAGSWSANIRFPGTSKTCRICCLPSAVQDWEL